MSPQPQGPDITWESGLKLGCFSRCCQTTVAQRTPLEGGQVRGLVWGASLGVVHGTAGLTGLLVPVP